MKWWKKLRCRLIHMYKIKEVEKLLSGSLNEAEKTLVLYMLNLGDNPFDIANIIIGFRRRARIKNELKEKLETMLTVEHWKKIKEMMERGISDEEIASQLLHDIFSINHKGGGCNEPR